jgi:hypothetical protein
MLQINWFLSTWFITSLADQSAIPHVVPEHLVRNIQPNFKNYQGGNLNYQYKPSSPYVQYQQTGSPQPQFAPQFNQFELM